MWQRFTERARKVVLAAQEEAQRMGSSHVDTEHLLLGLLGEEEGVAAQVLSKMGVSVKDVRAFAESLPPVPSVEPPSKEPRLTPQSKRVLELAADEARRIRHNYIGTEHLLLALLRHKDGLAAQVLKHFGLTLEKARQEVMEYLGPEAPAAAPAVAEAAECTARIERVARVAREIGVSLSPIVRRVLMRAMDIALAANSEAIEFEHLLEAVNELDKEAGQWE